MSKVNCQSSARNKGLRAGFRSNAPLLQAPGARASTTDDVSLTRFVLSEGSSFATLEQGLSVEQTADLYQFGDDSGPARLVASTDARAVVTMKVFVEQQVVPPMPIALEGFSTAEYRPAASLPPEQWRMTSLTLRP
jgi:hypothetical protein